MASTDDAAAQRPDRIVIDPLIASAFVAGNHEAVEAVFDQCSTRLRNFVWLSVGNRDTAEDVVQETFLQAYRQRARLKDPSRLLSWLFGIARNLALKELRRRRRRPESTVGEEALSMFENVPDTGSGVAVAMAESQLRTVLLESLLDLKKTERELIVLRYFVELPIKEIAEALEMPVGSVGTTIQRALAKIRVRYERQGIALGDLI